MAKAVKVYHYNFYYLQAVLSSSAAALASLFARSCTEQIIDIKIFHIPQFPQNSNELIPVFCLSKPTFLL
jgi:hypothetical protein